MTPSAKMIVKWLTYAIVMLAATATLGGLFIPNLYRDSIAITTVWRGCGHGRRKLKVKEI